MPDAPRVVIERCSGCGRCVAACPPHIITLEVRGYRKVAARRPARQCTACGKCAGCCPVGAITI